uniref:Uncharacterized protein n=3 Tax=Anguilla anguilla TaxID=7936 RepID=A0A0E9PJ09_ANGAN
MCYFSHSKMAGRQCSIMAKELFLQPKGRRFNSQVGHCRCTLERGT